ncbi:endonuclease MutS2 [Ilyobacter polytropus]|uniref:Endonuclease MutS2 n=1 Tax=Ilyobacter polytropus (strain ATCC 51220 / DSM 2926 / LMG 16218 / CuHBu1) TaxID=572544 RepID=E3H9T7_ILYPC|nr:endonuclease MutS2 [Ilyobacter polytropus]ADO83616.1 MutS2 family protein [Ilyobacter polytropus DSM 2926]
MNKHSLNVLEFDKLREEIAGYSQVEDTHISITEMIPYKDINLVKKELETVRDLMDFIKYDGGAETVGIKNINKIAKKSELIGAYLDAEDVWDIKENLKIFRLFKGKLEDLGKYKELIAKFKAVPIYKGLEEIINKAVDNEKNIKDDASLDLRDIRFQKKIIASNIKKKFDDIFSNSAYSKAIQEKIITTRDGRSVIPIKADFKGQIKGIEHDRSSSGQTVFIEPISIVSLNNKVRELEVREREEIRKILLRLTDQIRINLDGIYLVGDAILELDKLSAKANYALEKKCTVPEINNKEIISLVNARHPFIRPSDVVPLTFEIGRKYNTLLITGPNTGGKTVALKTAGLLTLMALSGVPIPAEEKTSIGYFTGIFADIGDEQSIEQSLSSFSAHLKNVQEILDNVTKSSLVLLDELGSGTDPMEGSAFAMAVIDYLKSKKCKAMISTHYSEVKAHGYNEDGIETASMEFDSNTLSPTYKLLMGVPGESNALTIAKRLGVLDEVIERAKSYISDENKKVESMISNIREQSEGLNSMKIQVEHLKEEAKKNKDEYENKLIALEKEKNEILKDAYEKADKMMREMQAKAKALVDKIQTEESKKEDAKLLQKSLNMMKNALKDEKNKTIVSKPKIKRKIEFKQGEKVFVKSMSQHAVVTRINEHKQVAQIQAGILKLEVAIDDLKKVEEPKTKQYNTVQVHKRTAVRSEIDIRGKMVDDAVHDLETYMDRALLNGFSEVYVIHGKGTGALRAGVIEYLKGCHYVKSFRAGGHGEGGIGCTVVTLK